MLLRLARRRQFSLLALLACMLLAGLGAAWYGNRLRAAAAAEAACRQISDKGGSVVVYGEASYVHFRPLGGLCGTGLVKVYSPASGAVNFTDADLPLLEHVPQLTSVDFNGAQVSPAAIAAFCARHPKLYVIP